LNTYKYLLKHSRYHFWPRDVRQKTWHDVASDQPTKDEENVVALLVLLHICGLRQVAFLRRKINGSTLDLAVQKVGIGAKENGGDSKHPGKGRRRTSATASLGFRVGANGLLHARKNVVDKGAATGIGVLKAHVGLALGGFHVRVFTELGDVVILVVVVVITIVVVVIVLIILGVPAGDAVVLDNKRFARVGKSGTVVLVGVDAGVGLVHALLVVKDSEVDGGSVACAVWSDVVDAVEAVLVVVVVLVVVIVVVTVLVGHFCRVKRKKRVHVSSS
jgi:hypothetical protein